MKRKQLKKHCKREICGEPFTTHNPRKVYCTDHCAKMAWWEKKKAILAKVEATEKLNAVWAEFLRERKL